MHQSHPDHDPLTAPRASQQDGTYPRPQLVRSAWRDLCGQWDFAFDDADAGLANGWHRGVPQGRQITVPFPPESTASGIGDTGFHSVAWYGRSLTKQDLEHAGLGAQGSRIRVNFGAVDYLCQAWVDGHYLGEHVGGHTPFSFDITDALDPSRTEHSLVVRAFDDPADVTQARGKQDWQLEPHVIWYHRTTGIWQPVWLEAVPECEIAHVHLFPDVPGANVRATVQLRGALAPNAQVRVALDYEGRALGEVTVPADRPVVEAVIALSSQRNGQDYEHLLWSPEAPRLVDATIELVVGPSPHLVDTASSYLGLRSVAVERGRFLLNDRPCYLRSVLNQGYWPQSHLAAPSAQALHDEVALIKDLGFNATRVHQKIEDPRFLFWADKLGLLVWEEMPSAFEFSTRGAKRIIDEWSEAIARDRSHPCIVTWVPLNESWGVQHISHDQQIQDFARTLWHLTKTLDPTRPVVSNDGWEHLDSDIWSIHDYEGRGEVLRERYASKESVAQLFEGMGPAGRRIRVLAAEPGSDQPVMLTEFGGVKFEPNGAHGEAWGYTAATSPEDFEARLRSILEAVHASESLAGFCYTQLTDTLQEANGLVTADRDLKLPSETISAMIRGQHSQP